MKSKEDIELRIKVSEDVLEIILNDIKNCSNYELIDSLIDRKIQEQTIKNTLEWVLKEKGAVN